MKEFWNTIQLVFAAVGGWLGYFLGGCDGLLIALVIFVTWRPIHLIWGAPLFAFCYWAYTYIPVMVSSKFNFVGFNDLLQMLPYLVTIIILIINSLKKKKENQPPQSLGVAYFRENR